MRNTDHQEDNDYREITESMLAAFDEMINYCHEHNIDESFLLEQTDHTNPAWDPILVDDRLYRTLIDHIETDHRSKEKRTDTDNEPKEINNAKYIPF